METFILWVVCRELETESSGIEGILNGLEKERSLSFGMGTLGKEDRWGDFSSNAVSEYVKIFLFFCLAKCTASLFCCNCHVNGN